VWTLGLTYWDWWEPKTHEERQATKQAQEINAIERLWRRHHAINDLAAELDRGAHVIAAEAHEGRMFAPLHEDTAWRRHKHELPGWGLSEERRLGAKAHELLRAISDQKRDRSLQGSELDRTSEVLTAEERRAREEAVPIVDSAATALRQAQDEAP
jgi:hypothetical protein